VSLANKEDENHQSKQGRQRHGKIRENWKRIK
jgi:hypothetical protein